jgi:hypothetical protein
MVYYSEGTPHRRQSMRRIAAKTCVRRPTGQEQQIRRRYRTQRFPGLTLSISCGKSIIFRIDSAGTGSRICLHDDTEPTHCHLGAPKVPRVRLRSCLSCRLHCSAESVAADFCSCRFIARLRNRLKVAGYKLNHFHPTLRPIESPENPRTGSSAAAGRPPARQDTALRISLGGTRLLSSRRLCAVLAGQQVCRTPIAAFPRRLQPGSSYVPLTQPLIFPAPPCGCLIVSACIIYH